MHMYSKKLLRVCVCAARDLHGELVADLELDHAHNEVSLGAEHRQLPLAGEVRVEGTARGGRR